MTNTSDTATHTYNAVNVVISKHLQLKHETPLRYMLVWTVSSSASGTTMAHPALQDKNWRPSTWITLIHLMQIQTGYCQTATWSYLQLEYCPWKCSLGQFWLYTSSFLACIQSLAMANPGAQPQVLVWLILRKWGWEGDHFEARESNVVCNWCVSELSSWFLD